MSIALVMLPGVTCVVAQTAGVPYENMPEIAPIGVRIDKHIDVPESAKGPAIDRAKGYRVEKLGKNLYMVTEGVYQAMFLVYDKGVVLVDAPPSVAPYIHKAIAEVTNQPVTYIVYSHSHSDHIGGTRSLGGHPVIIAQEETKRRLLQAHDPDRPLPAVTFAQKYTLKVGAETLELSYGGYGHEPGNIYIYAPDQKVLMVVDVIYPGWMMWRRFALAEDIPGFYKQVDDIEKFDFTTLVAGHVARLGTRADVELQRHFMKDLRDSAGAALKSTRVGEQVSPADSANPWAVYGNYLDRSAIKCVNDLTPRWSRKLAGFDVFIWDQCYAMEQSLLDD
jgi:glyoxylase-like metal-dependent hydrolase (beta-lactamase superfamily II)